MARPRLHDHEVVLNMLAGGMRATEIAARIGATPAQIHGITERARRKGDPRAVKKRDVAHKEPVTRPVDRPGVMVVNVTCTKHTTDGTLKSVPVSLPRLSILDGWTGSATAHSSGGAA